ncbi:prolyl oligopeptidase family serine peptidase [Fulvivirgaceae bacterium PWU20]|uniref:Prolyl oligopeptidase family serine peptidase n=2 Tax=Chryseosolibacter indicus TaxID=2782351 RepID=A0ABS5VP06_9BACT|nr:prolyl oligopeptidase family serine peptidase [Chryseosolibacter indicus]
MVLALLGLLLVLSCAVVWYAYRWNVFHPLKQGKVVVGGLERTFVYHVPKKLKGRPKLIMGYPGTKMTAGLMQVFTGHEFDELADRDENAIIVYLQGYKSNWNDCRKVAPYPSKKLNIDDVAFTEKVISYFADNYSIDKHEVFAVGFSNGGSMVMKLAKLKPEWFKGFAAIGTNLPEDSNNDCTAVNQPVSLIYINGEEDPIVPFRGGRIILDGDDFGVVKSAEETLMYWLNSSQCDINDFSVKPFHTSKSSKEITAYQYNYHSPATGKRISFVRITDGGHTIPNRNFRIPITKLGAMNKEVDAPVLIWDFFMSLN